MNLKEILNKDVDKAWESLYQRLDEDGLLEPERRPGRNLIAWRWAASIAILLIGGVSLFLLSRNNDQPTEDMMVLHNAQGQPTLVTTLEDGSTVFLTEETFIEYPTHFISSKREIHLNGDAFFEIARNENSPFIIDTKTVLIEVLGTSFSVKSKEDESFSLSVRTGKVRVTSKSTGENLEVRAGETALLHSQKLSSIQTTDLDRFQLYLDRIYFKDQTLANVVRIMNEKSKDSLQIKYAPELSDRKFNVSFSAESPREIAEVICAGLNLTHHVEEDAIYITRNTE